MKCSDCITDTNPRNTLTFTLGGWRAHLFTGIYGGLISMWAGGSGGGEMGLAVIPLLSYLHVVCSLLAF